jgi:hypothetical protein
MLRRSAEMLETSNDKAASLIAVRHTLWAVEDELRTKHHDRWLDELLGTKENAHG